jgi:hypothetical protein
LICAQSHNVTCTAFANKFAFSYSLVVQFSKGNLIGSKKQPENQYTMFGLSKASITF